MDMNIDEKILELQKKLERSNNSTFSETKRKNGIRLPISSFILLIAMFAIFASQTFAFFTDSQTSQANKIEAGSVDVSLIEVNGNGSFNDSTEPVKIMPASVYSYGGVGVHNSGTLPVYVRIKIEKNILSSEYEISEGWEDLIDCNFAATRESLPEEERDLWFYHDGYYYYKLALAPGEKTTSLFDKVLFAPTMGNEFKNSTIQFIIICQTVQSNGNSGDPLSATGWIDDNGNGQ